MTRTMLKGQAYTSDRNNSIRTELASWLGNVNAETGVELRTALGGICEAVNSIYVHIQRVQVEEENINNINSPPSSVLPGEEGEHSARFAYDNVSGITELAPVLRQATVVEKMIR